MAPGPWSAAVASTGSGRTATSASSATPGPGCGTSIGRAFALDPVNLPLSPETFLTTKRSGLFGVLADTTPDRWGQRLFRLHLPRPMSPRDWLLATGDERVGCLAFSPTPEPPPAAPCSCRSARARRSPMRSIGSCAARMPTPSSRRFIAPAKASAGSGRRPSSSTTAICGSQSFSVTTTRSTSAPPSMRPCGSPPMRHSSRRDQARRVGGGRRAVLVKRFDRGPAPTFARPRISSARCRCSISRDLHEGLLPADRRGPAPACAAHARDLEELFRRMLFNVLCGNRDDHLKNHALLHGDAGGASPPPSMSCRKSASSSRYRRSPSGRSVAFPRSRTA